MSFDLDKMQVVIELGEVIRLQNEALERLVAFRKARPSMMMPNLVKMVEENLKDNIQVLYKELNNLHKPADQRTRYICRECQMAFLSALPNGICDECRARLGSTQPRAYVPQVDAEVAPAQEPVPADIGTDTFATDDAPSVEPAQDEQTIANAYNEAMGDEGIANPDLLLEKPHAVNLPSDDTELFLADGAEPPVESTQAEADIDDDREAVETIPDHDISPATESGAEDSEQSRESIV